MMPTLTPMDQLLGSLVGAYIGHYYAHGQSLQDHPPWPHVSDTPLYQAWVQNAQLLKPAQPQTASASVIMSLPWLLYHHDNSRLRHQQLAQYLAAAPASPTEHPIELLSALYVLGDVLEWLMQYPQELPNPLPKLQTAWSKQLTDYPAVVIPWLRQLMKTLEETPSAEKNYAAGPMTTLTLAIQQGFNYRENLALAYANPQMPPATLPIVGCLLGAWGGPSIIPLPWMLSFSLESRQALTQLAQQLYQRWAGICDTADNVDVWPLDF